MDLLLIKTLIEAMQGSDLAEMEVRVGDWTLRMARDAGASPGIMSHPVPVAGPAPQSESPGQADPGGGEAPVSSPVPGTDAAAAGVTAPLAGIVHLTPGPVQPPFVLPGQKVEAGTTLCLIEAMKVFNAVKAERDAVIAAVLVTTETEVEAGQPLMTFA